MVSPLHERGVVIYLTRMAELTFHPAHPPLAVRSIDARIIMLDSTSLRLRWKITGADKLVVPPFAGKGRADGLWQTTCFEVFLKSGEGTSYTEVNLSPSERWNIYDFSDVREGMAERHLSYEPSCNFRMGTEIATFDAVIPARDLPATPWQCGFTAVIEELGGVKSYWALAHASETPDFHDPSCFLEMVAAPSKS